MKKLELRAYQVKPVQDAISSVLADMGNTYQVLGGCLIGLTAKATNDLKGLTPSSFHSKVK